jgi:hypothetical protein
MIRFTQRGRHAPPEPSWKAYQESLRRQYFPTRRTRLDRSRPWLVVGLLILVIAGIGWVLADGVNQETGAAAADSIASPTAGKDPTLIAKTDVHILLGKTPLINLQANPLTVEFDGRPYQVSTSLNLGLQQHLLKSMDRVNSRYIGIVAMAPDTGRILAMAGFNKRDPDRDPCLVADYPAASLFKIITAAAAVEEKAMRPVPGLISTATSTPFTNAS